MPYIEPIDRVKFNELIQEAGKLENCGELNYVISKVCLQYLNKKGLKYQHINDIIGALEGSKLELYRRVASPYENLKIESNGDIL